MKSIFYFSILLLFFSCDRYREDFSKINISSIDNINAKNKIVKRISIRQNGENSQFETRIKYRGGSSIGYPKKNFTINLSEEYKFHGFKKDDDFILGASVSDKTFLRNVLCYHLFNSFHSNNIAPKTNYSDVYFDNDYYGFYVLTERLDKSVYNLDKSSGLVFKEPAVFRDYDLQLDSLGKDSGNYYHQKYPKDAVRNFEIDSLKNFILFAQDSIFEKEIFHKISKQSVIDWHILLKLSNGGDGLLKNFILYKKNDEKKFRISPWDCDHSFGRDGDNELNLLQRKIDMKKNILIKRLMNNPKIRYNDSLKKRWKKLRKKKIISKKTLKRFIDKESEKIKPFVQRNFKKWPLTGWPYHDDNDFEAEIELMKRFVDIRIPQLDSLYKYK